MGWGMKDPAAKARRQLERQEPSGWTRPGPSRTLERGLVLLFLGLAAAAVWFSLTAHDRSRAADPATAVAREEVVGVREGSLLRPANLREALNALAVEAGREDGLDGLRITPARITATMVQPNYDRYWLSYNLGGRITRMDLSIASGETPRMSLRGFDVQVPARAARAAAAGADVSPDKVEYVGVHAFTGAEPTITVGLLDVPNVLRTWSGRGDGSQMTNPHASRLREPVAPPPVIEGDLDDPVRIARCVEAAGTDPARIRACLR